MQKYKAKKEVVEQVTSKLKLASKVGNLAENNKKMDLETEYSKLQASKNIFSRGDFDEYKVKNLGITEDGCTYNLDNPTERYYYELKKELEKKRTDSCNEDIEKGLHKYISKKFENGKWVYKYHQDRKQAVKNLISCSEPLLKCNINNAKIEGEKFLKDWNIDWNNNPNKSKSSVLGKHISIIVKDANGNDGISLLHFAHKGSTKNQPRDPNEILMRAKLLPIAKEMLENKNKATVYEVRNDGNYVEYSLVGKFIQNGKEKKVCVIISKNKKEGNVYLSVMRKAISLDNDIAFITDVFLLKPSKNVQFSAEQRAYSERPFPNRNSIIPNSQDMSSKNIAKSTISDKLFRLWQRRLSPELQNEMLKLMDDKRDYFHLIPKKVYKVEGYPKGQDLENCELMELADTYFIIACCGDWQDEKLVRFEIGNNDKLFASVVKNCEKEDKRVLNKKVAYIINPETINKSLFTDWKVELHHLCDKKGLDYDSIIQKYDSQMIRFVAEEQLHQDAENVIAYKAYKDLNKSLTYSGHKLQGRTKLYGMDISIENKKGSYRSGVDSDGHNWKTLMHYDYGYIRGTEGTDGDHVDCFVGPAKDSNKVYVIHQNNPVTHKYDEDKCMLCFESADAAKKGYMKQYDRPGFFGSMDILTIDEFKSYVFSHLGKRIHKSFDIVVTDITENNRQKKIKQVEKSLIALSENRPFVIKHIPIDKSKKYGDITLRITDFDKSKIEKAVHKMAFTLDGDITSSDKGEPFVYASQEEITNRIVTDITNRTKEVYSFLLNYLGLPEMRIVTKADVEYKGKVIYSPETGKPMTRDEWNKFVRALQTVLDNNYNGIGERIILDSHTLGILLEKMSKTHSFEEIQKLKLKQMNYAHREFDWISRTAQNMKSTFGESLSRDRQARIQVAIDSAAMRITRINDNLRDNIQQVIIDGIKNKQSKSQVSQELFNNCVGFNRDLQRIADTEIQNNINHAYVMEQYYNSKPGTKIYFKRVEIMDNITCKRCRNANGKIVLFSDTPLQSEKINDSYADYAIWEGKLDGNLPMSNFHPWCRGAWIRTTPVGKYYKLAQEIIRENENGNN